MPDERERIGKPRKAHVILEAKNAGGDILIIIQDDGKGINTEKVLKKARENGLTTKPDHEYTEKEIQQFIFLPGFSTNDKVTNFSGRGVGMDVVVKNLEICGGTALVESTPGVGTTFTLKIPLTLAIIEGMSVRVAGAQYTIPIANIIKSLKAKKEDLFNDPNGNEMISVRGEIFNIVRLHEFFGIEGAITNIEDGTLMQLENGDKKICLLVDELLGQQQAVVKPMPKYFKRVRGIGGCTLLGTGDVSIIADVPGFFDN
jgi:two-component system chemotaxis sensor kinase CheA